MVITLNGSAMTDRESIYAELHAKMPLPEYFGNNLDALFDVLTETEGEIVLENSEALTAAGGYGQMFLRVLNDAAKANPALKVTIG